MERGDTIIKQFLAGESMEKLAIQHKLHIEAVEEIIRIEMNFLDSISPDEEDETE